MKNAVQHNKCPDFWHFLEFLFYLVILIPQLRYTVNTPMDYGSVSCSVAAEMTQDDAGIGAGRPCVYHIVPAGKWVTLAKFEERKASKCVK